MKTTLLIPLLTASLALLPILVPPALHGAAGDADSLKATTLPTGGTFSIKPPSPVTAKTKLTATFTDWTSADLPLTYEVSAGKTVVVPAGKSATPTFTLPEGTHALTGRVYDSLGHSAIAGTISVFVAGAGDPGWPVLTFVRAGAEPVPGRGVDPRIPQDARFGIYHEPAINDAGQLAYFATWTSATAGNGGGIFVDDTLIAALGETAPGARGRVSTYFSSFKDPVMSGDGRVAFLATLGDLSAAKAAVVTNAFGSGRTLTIVALAGDSAVISPNVIVGQYGSFESVSLQSAGGEHGLLFTGKLGLDPRGIPRVSTTNDSVACLRTEGFGRYPVIVVRAGQAAPGLPGETIKSFTLLKAPGFSGGHGRGHFLAENVDVPVLLNDRPGFPRGRRGLLEWRAGMAGVSRLTGDPTPLAGVLWNKVGPVAHGVSAAGSFGVAADSDAIFSLRDTGDAMLLRVGDPAPGGFTIVGLQSPVASATSTSIAAPGYVTIAPSGQKYFALIGKPGSGNVEVIARNGGRTGVPSHFPGATWWDLDSLALPGGAIGPIFTAKATASGFLGKGLYAKDSTGTIRRLLQQNEVHRINNALQTVQTFYVLTPLSGTTGVTRSFNSASQVAALVRFRGGDLALVRIDVP